MNNTIDQLDLRDIYRTLPPTRAGYTLLSNSHGTHTRIHRISENTASPVVFITAEIIEKIL